MFTPTSIADRVVQSILAHRLDAGERMGEQAMADLFGVSRTVVREALIRLQARGLVDVRPRLGWYVVAPTWAEARDIFAARRILEPGMLRDAVRPDQSVIRQLRRHLAVERQQIDDAASRSRVLAEFHVGLAEHVGGRLVAAMTVALVARTALIAGLKLSAGQAQEASDDHAAIVEALTEGDMPAAEGLMRAHLDTLAARLDETLFHTGNAHERLRDALADDAPVDAAVPLAA